MMTFTSEMMRGPLLITGAGGGIGRAIARHAAAADVPLALFDVDREGLESIADELSSETKAEVVAATCDVSDEAEVDAAVDSAVERLGAPAGLVTAAGIDRGAMLHALEASVFDAVLRVNLRGTFLSCRACLRHMIEGGGSIVCLSSPLALVATPGGSGAYSASKAAVSALVRSLAVDYARHGIRVNALLPGPTETELMWASVPAEKIPELREVVRDEVPLGRLAQPEEVARAAAWLLSDDSSFVTGAQLACDGGVLAKGSVSL